MFALLILLAAAESLLQDASVDGETAAALDASVDGATADAAAGGATADLPTGEEDDLNGYDVGAPVEVVDADEEAPAVAGVAGPAGELAVLAGSPLAVDTVAAVDADEATDEDAGDEDAEDEDADEDGAVSGGLDEQVEALQQQLDATTKVTAALQRLGPTAEAELVRAHAATLLAALVEQATALDDLQARRSSGDLDDVELDEEVDEEAARIATQDRMIHVLRALAAKLGDQLDPAEEAGGRFEMNSPVAPPLNEPDTSAKNEAAWLVASVVFYIVA